MDSRSIIKSSYYSQSDREVKRYFNKKFIFRGPWTLPQKAYQEHIVNIEDFLDMKNKLNEVKSQLNDLPLEEWSKFTKYRDPSGSVIRSLRQFEPEILTQAWCKFYEILSQFQMLPESQLFATNEPLQTLHLCEAPGGFISALNHFLAKNYPKLQWKWTGFTLNPFHEGLSISEMIPDDRLIRYTPQNWKFGLDSTGDITQYYNYLSLVKEMEGQKIGLVTADGSIDCMFKPEEQESIVHFIHYCEIITALSVLSEGGNFVIKMFTMFEQPTISLVYLLNCSFREVTVYKPCTSKHGNSEVYILCRFYNGKEHLKDLWSSLKEAYQNPNDFNDLALFTWDDMGPDYLHQIRQLCQYFMDMQVRTINDNLNNFGKNHRCTRTNRIKYLVADYFLSNFGVVKLENDRKIIHPSFFEQVTQEKRFCFHNRFWRYKPEWKFSENYHSLSNLHLETERRDLLNIDVGKAVTKVLYSPYYSCNLFPEFNFEMFRKKSTGDLYNLCKRSIHYDTVIISMLELSNSENNVTFQRNLFETITSKLDYVNKCLMFVQVPFVTNFVVSLLFILSLAFENVVFLRGGTVILLNPTQKGIQEVKKYFNVIDFVYKCIDKYCYFKFTVDILQIISPLVFEKSQFYRCVWNYNNSLLKLYLNK
ncbi:cap-specific mRNA (nucleoside-2'-O-)-methyltransferase 2 [Agrilus planipennis]|uniref:Cap-specific mRNA (nucleoside-2'-O-)-methyltransferase 2 n=2 Tax=Agrilus planipennis TaxID=224129 RepID=A0A7F5RDC7_AGRPL|nr:cap-specific mRNA (nucleoside-2'-O-)-methyltransferase 2 [Agrilus planipennis]